MITEYIVMKAYALQDLVNDVNVKIVEGYQPLGGVTFIPVYSDNSGKLYIQAMVKS